MRSGARRHLLGGRVYDGDGQEQDHGQQHEPEEPAGEDLPGAVAQEGGGAAEGPLHLSRPSSSHR